MGKKYSCGKCSYVAFSQRSLTCHFNKYHMMDKVKCPECDVELSKVSLTGHIRKIHRNKNRNCCSNCNYTTSSIANMKRHVMAVHLKETDKCPKCEKVLKKDGLKMHLKKVHMNFKHISCPICSYSSYTRYNIKTHIKAVHLNTKEECQECGKKIAFGGLAAHIKRVHMKIKKHKCTHCKHCTISAQEMKLHIKMVHLVEKENCSICHAELSNIQSLKRHQKLVHKKGINKDKRVKDKRRKCRTLKSIHKLDDDEYMDILWDSIAKEEDNEDKEKKSQIYLSKCPVDGCQDVFHSVDDITAHLMSQHELM